ncbi:thiol:disulfide interchange protein TlpA [Methylopila jiangsuensis]|uniref:Thiol:disulfide interchange protein TlpA n=1 Tax=Methylopila jiangsuensis TaxID=586230 RepID=A0A9W6JJF8_9HYPH|nr:TlpA disulfide reductase family protein [Methylopila jiangsuensis]MDR6285281.1 thiol-disulfide isomerase/thioredoxin [Methylopila jiangsuensis]GLK77328.1 thiol:disulfide interchange protein TlpA [Methylopila jiangsuensis]
MPEPTVRQSHSLLGRPWVRRGLLGAAAVAGLAALALYGIGGGDKAQAACAASSETLAAMAKAARGEVAGVVVPSAPRPLPPLTFQDAAGAATGLDRFRGKVTLLNLWATWCAPCRKEMPALDQLEAERGGAEFEVVAVSLDFGGTDKPKAFLKEIGSRNLAFYADPTNKLFRDLRAVGRGSGMPTTLILDRAGCEIGFLPGPAEWASADALKLIDAALGR